MASFYASASFTRPADTTAYASGDLVANSTTAGSVSAAQLNLPAACAIRRVRLVKSGTSTANASFRVHLYHASPTAANGDNGAFSTDKAANYIGAFDVTVGQAFTDGAVGFGVPITGSDISITPSVVFALVEARAAYTPGNAEVFTVGVEAQD